MLNMPVKINAIIQAKYQTAQELQIIGFPELSFMQDDEMIQFVDYMQSYLESNATMRAEFERRIEIYNNAKEVTTHTLSLSFTSLSFVLLIASPFHRRYAWEWLLT